jgi:hypothetical protein
MSLQLGLSGVACIQVDCWVVQLSCSMASVGALLDIA